MTATSTPRFSIDEITTPHLTFSEDLQLFESVGATGIGITPGRKLVNGAADFEAFRRSPLEASVCGLRMTHVLPTEMHGSPEDPDDRVALIEDALEEIAPYRPACCIAGPGPIGAYEPQAARAIAVRGLRRVAHRAADLGITIGIEPIHRSISDRFSFVTTVPMAIELCEEIGEPNVGVVVDFWHLWDTPDFLTQIDEHVNRIVGVQVDDCRHESRTWCDRVLPGDGISGVSAIFAALQRADYRGWLDLEIMSDDGLFGESLADSLWARDPKELAREGLRRMEELWGSAAVDGVLSESIVKTTPVGGGEHSC